MSEALSKPPAVEADCSFTLHLRRADEPTAAHAAKREPQLVTLKKGGKLPIGAARWYYERLIEVDFCSGSLLAALYYLSLSVAERQHLTPPRCTHALLAVLVEHQLIKVVQPPPPEGALPGKDARAHVDVPVAVRAVVRSAVTQNGGKVTLECPYVE